MSIKFVTDFVTPLIRFGAWKPKSAIDFCHSNWFINCVSSGLDFKVPFVKEKITAFFLIF